MRQTVCVILLLAFSAMAQAQTFRVCESAQAPLDLPREGFKHRRNRAASVFRDRHSVNDVLAVFGRAVTLEAKFSFGLLGRDVFDEEAEIWIDRCGPRYTMIHRAQTDGHGRIKWTMPADLLNTPGQYRIWMRLVGDGSSAFATLRLVESQRKIAVFDVDGTLTTHETDLTLNVLSELAKGCFSPPRRAYSAELTQLFKARGYEIVYLSGRHYFLNELTRKWLLKNDFAPGTVVVTQSVFQALPNQRSVGKYKSSELTKLKAAGFFIERAYGNAWTDISRYKEAGIPNKNIYVVGRFSGLWGGVPLGMDFEKHYQSLTNGENGVAR